MTVAALVSRLIAAGTPPEVAAMVVTEAFVAGATSTGIPPDSTAEKRRAYDRERKRTKPNSTGIPPDSTGIPNSALTLKDKVKKVRASKHGIPHDWEPKPGHFEAAEKLSIPRSSVLSKAEDMRIWAGSSGATKVDWDLTFHGFLRRDAPKLAVRGSVAMTPIGPQSPSWNAWKAYYRDNGKNFHAGQMDKSASNGKLWTVPTEWPPGHKMEAA